MTKAEVFMKFLLVILLPWLVSAAEQMRVLPVNPTPEPATAYLTIALPHQNQVLKNKPYHIQFRIDGFALQASSSQFPRSQELALTDMGQTVHIIVDDHPYFPINGPAIEPLREESGYYYDSGYKVEIPFALKEGVHLIRAFPARSYGESLKGENTFQTCIFYVGEASSDKKFDLSKPYLTYNEPSDNFDYTEGRPILLDFLINNCELTKDGYKVKLTVDGKFNRILTTWQPYYIYGLEKGTHSIRLELLDRKDQLVSGPFSKVERKIVIQK